MASDPIGKYDAVKLDFGKPHHDTYAFISPENADLTGKHVLITGTSKGIGYATALSFAKAGASTIVIAARSPQDGLVKEMQDAAAKAGRQPPKIVVLKLDVTDRASMEENGTIVKDQVGHLDILIMNTGCMERTKLLLDSDPGEWWQVWSVNMLGTYLTLRAFLPLVISSPNADRTVVALSSAAAVYAQPGRSAYQPSKLALARLMEFICVEYGDKGVLAYSVHPGSIRTEMSLLIQESWHHLLTDTPQLPADTLVWLVKERREWLAGRWLSCTWDMEDIDSRRPEIERRDLLRFRLALGGEDPSQI